MRPPIRQLKVILPLIRPPDPMPTFTILRHDYQAAAAPNASPGGTYFNVHLVNSRRNAHKDEIGPLKMKSALWTIFLIDYFSSLVLRFRLLICKSLTEDGTYGSWLLICESLTEDGTHGSRLLICESLTEDGTYGFRLLICKSLTEDGTYESRLLICESLTEDGTYGSRFFSILAFGSKVPVLWHFGSS
ncbi:hypothetical protein RhiirA4_430654, partial [Rhizophagus irregularis]